MRQLITSEQITKWFSSRSRDAQEILPHLVRKLITATVSSDHLRALRFPAGDDIISNGFDGVLETTDGNRFVPEGLSVWEIGTGPPTKKCEMDYRTRTKNPLGVAPKQTTFVIVTPHVWGRKDSWVAEKQHEGQWKSVRLLDGADLSTWLEVAPAVARWLARQMGVPIDGFVDVELFLKELGAAYNCDLPAELVIGGRNSALAELADWLEKGSSDIDIEGESIEEAAAFVGATMLSLPADKSDWLVSRTFFVHDPAVLDLVSPLPSAHIVVPLTIGARRRAKALQSGGLRLILPIVRSAGTFGHSDSTIRLGPIARSAFAQALIATGTTEQKAQRIARDCKGSFTAGLWMVSRGPDAPLPWTQGTAATELAPLLFAGQWQADAHEDQRVIERLAARSYKDVEFTLARWRDPIGPLTQRSALWGWLAADYAWDCLAPAIDRNMLYRLRTVIIEVFSHRDPRLDLPPEQRWAAALYDKSHPISAELRAGLVASLAQLALHDRMVESGDAVAAGIIRDLLQNQSMPRKDAWLSLSPWLPDVAEAAPVDFLSATESLLTDHDALAPLFSDGGAFGSSPHVHLLWALERLSWCEHLFTRTVLVLGDLAAADPGGQLRNRPSQSLVEIFLPWHPQGCAEPEHRLSAIELLYERQPHVAWSLVASLLPDKVSFASPIAEPRWREWKPPSSPRVTVPDYWGFIESVCHRMLKWAGVSGQRWSDLINAYPPLRKGHSELASRLVSSLQQLEVSDFASEDRLLITISLRTLIARHRDFHKEAWALRSPDLDPLVALLDRFEPQDPSTRHRWIFASWPTLPKERHLTYDEYVDYLTRMRLSAIEEILHDQALDGVLDFSKVVESPEAVGFCLSQLGLSPAMEAQLINQTLTHCATQQDIPKLLRLGLSYVAGRYDKEGTAWPERIRELPEVHWDANSLANLAWGLPADGTTWDRLQSWGEAAANIYWSRVPLVNLPQPERDAERAVVNLLASGRPRRAICVAGMSLQADPNGTNRSAVTRDSIIRALTDASKQDSLVEWYAPNPNIVAHSVEQLLDVAEELGVSSEELAKLEWMWMPELERGQRGMKAIQKLMGTSPALFLDLLTLVFRGEGEEPTEPTEDEQARATQAYRLLGNWRLVPGTQERCPKQKRDDEIPFDKGTIDKKSLFEWIEQARELARSAKRLKVCDSQIGQLLAYAPEGSDGIWPCEPVRDLLEKLSSEKLEQGMAIGVFNKRGVHYRGKGGNQERKLAEQFRAYERGVHKRWPRTAGLLNGIAKSYEQDARREDERAKFEEFQ